MSKPLTPALTITSRTILQRRRELPLAGEVLVRQGDLVAGTDVVARASLEGDLQVVRVGDVLGIPAEDVASCVCVKLDDSVKEGQKIAEIRGLWGLFRSNVFAPITGKIEFISSSTGHVGIRAPARPLDLTAYISGRVVAVETGRAVIIESEATFVQGIFGIGGERQGRIKVLAIVPQTQVRVEHLPEDLAGCVVVGGHSPSAEVLNVAAQRGAVGFVTGSIDDSALRGYLGYDIGVALTGDEEISMTVIVTEGFGALSMSERALEVLRAIDGEIVSLNGATQVRAGAQRPELISAKHSEGQGCSIQGVGLEIGARVRLIREPFFGAFGVVSALPSELSKIETGASVRVVQVKIAHDREVLVPRANVELVV